MILAAETVRVVIDHGGGGLLADLAKVAPLVTAGVAIWAVRVARRSLQASRASVATAQRSVEAAERALRGAVRPILKGANLKGVGEWGNEGQDQPMKVEIANIGPGVAVSVSVTVNGLSFNDPWSRSDTGGSYEGSAKTMNNAGPIAPNQCAWVPVRHAGQSLVPGGVFEVVTVATDVSGDQHWSVSYVGEDHMARNLAPEIGIGDLPVHFRSVA